MRLPCSPFLSLFFFSFWFTLSLLINLLPFTLCSVHYHFPVITSHTELVEEFSTHLVEAGAVRRAAGSTSWLGLANLLISFVLGFIPNQDMAVSFHLIPNSVLGIVGNGRNGADYLPGSGLAWPTIPTSTSLLFYRFISSLNLLLQEQNKGGLIHHV